ncbi:MAG: aminodeoxyfutalosine deaminase [Frankiales bacterium]|jgi:aminodeoxyfutalosine deaminase|nr:aminodeoxyfutalosine deaminase [Frankiales bacterium]
MVAPYPKIELHVHLEGTVRPATLLDIARRNNLTLPADTEEGIAELYRFRDFSHFVEVWIMTTHALRTADDFRQVVVDYAGEAAGFGAVYLEAIFSPIERVARGVQWAELFDGYCDGAEQAYAEHGVTVRLTPDIYRGADVEAAEETARWAVRYRDRGVVGLGIGGLEADFAPEPYAKAFAIARDGGLGAVPHAGEVAGPESIRATVAALGADRIRHGIRAIEDSTLLDELIDRGTVLDVCPVSNLRTRVVEGIAAHPLPKLIAAGLRCTLNTDDPAMFSTDLGYEHELARSIGVDPQSAYDAGVAGALCDAPLRERLASIGAATDWAAV